MNWKIVEHTMVFMLVTITANGVVLPWGPREMKRNAKLDSLQPRIVARFLLGLHGELFWMEDYNVEYLRNTRCLAVKNEEGTGIELLVERDLEFILYANVLTDGTVTYSDTPEARALTGEVFCGIRRWPEKDLLSKAPERGQSRVFVDTSELTYPKRPKGCEGVAYALSDGAFFFCQPNDVYSPYPLWLVRIDKKRMKLIPTDGTDITLLEIVGRDKTCYITIFKDAWMGDIIPPYKGLYNEDKNFSNIHAPTRMLYISKNRTNAMENYQSEIKKK